MYHKQLQVEHCVLQRSAVALPLDAVVMVLSVGGHPDFSCPWQKKQVESGSSGFVIGDRRVLTCAHSVDHHTLVMLKNRNSDYLYEASVLAVAPECDIGMTNNELVFVCFIFNS